MGSLKIGCFVTIFEHETKTTEDIPGMSFVGLVKLLNFKPYPILTR